MGLRGPDRYDHVTLATSQRAARRRPLPLIYQPPCGHLRALRVHRGVERSRGRWEEVPPHITAGDPYAACPPIGAGVNFPDAEVEPFVGVNPTNPANIVAVYQQDRYSNGNYKGTVSSASFDGGATGCSGRCRPTRCAPAASTTAHRTRGSASGPTEWRMP